MQVHRRRCVDGALGDDPEWGFNVLRAELALLNPADCSADSSNLFGCSPTFCARFLLEYTKSVAPTSTCRWCRVIKVIDVFRRCLEIYD